MNLVSTTDEARAFEEIVVMFHSQRQLHKIEFEYVALAFPASMLDHPIVSRC